MGVKPENHFPKNWKFNPQNEDVDDGIYKDSGFMFEIIISRNLEIRQIFKLYMQGNQTASFNLKMLIIHLGRAGSALLINALDNSEFSR